VYSILTPNPSSFECAITNTGRSTSKPASNCMADMKSLGRVMINGVVSMFAEAAIRILAWVMLTSNPMPASNPDKPGNVLVYSLSPKNPSRLNWLIMTKGSGN